MLFPFLRTHSFHPALLVCTHTHTHIVPPPPLSAPQPRQNSHDAIVWLALGGWYLGCCLQVPVLSGKTASKEFINRIIRVSINHDERIKCLDTVLVYHFGSNFLVELHVVLDPDMTLRESHDVTAPLQVPISQFFGVGRKVLEVRNGGDSSEPTVNGGAGRGSKFLGVE